MTLTPLSPRPQRTLISRLQPPQLIALVYIVGIVVGTLLLHLPGVTTPGAKLNSIDLLFTATSAICITGLVVADTAEVFTRTGQVIIILLSQIGGLGIIAFGTLFALLAGRRVNFTERQHLVQQINALNVGSVLSLVRTIFLYTMVAEAAGAALLALRFVPQFGWGEGLYHAVFHSISAYNNAGFVVMPGGMAQYAQDPLVSGVIALQIILGGLGFLVQLNVLAHWRSPRRNRLLVYSKLTLSTTAALLVLGTLALLLLEWHNTRTLGDLGMGGRLLTAFFQSVTPRSGGFATVDIESLTNASLFLMIALMFIGANSGSTGGGIKTSTFAILLGSAWNLVSGRTELITFKRRILPENVVRAGTITTIYTLLVFTAFFAMLVTNPELGFTHLLFETVSAAATVGLTMNTTHLVNDPGLLILTVLMYLGRIGPVTFALALNQRQQRRNAIKYPAEQDILVG
ncbi:TrkH family potassium uptake protein [Deinococcus deserti]|uniref:Putative K+ uptake transporter (Trk family) putative membrane protein n=1 Tax=Deinococcus deserti (strain DSM 17065 / CIP 109153 / LMG 22923 / VCD115) TaxID=546414 RepID=C1CZV3_DEIDV|nr:TrkH family potassium uptake protein [Deinococcus deserti]ACO45205.1 putative K+ uptake transporter (Trk family); putative membrane protein [Deinococcus deserti VCD115]